jgi:hypothetical protein
MTSNGSEALNSVFRVERTLPVAAIMEGTWYKSAKWFDKREMKALCHTPELIKWIRGYQ